MSRWFRLYDDVLDDPKVQRLPERLFKSWVNTLCLASRHDGVLPPVADIAFAFRVSAARAADDIRQLTDAGLIDEVDGQLVPHAWSERQFKSDVSNERVKTASGTQAQRWL